MTIVDRHPDRLRLAESVGVIPIDDAKGAPVEQVMELTEGQGADRGCECVGWRAYDPQGQEHPTLTMNNLVRSVRPTGRIGVVGVFVPKDPKSPDEFGKGGQNASDMGLFFQKGLSMGSGQCNVKNDNRRTLRRAGRRLNQGDSIAERLSPLGKPRCDQGSAHVRPLGEVRISWRRNRSR